MSTFTPPVLNLLPTITADSEGIPRRAASFRKPNPRGVNVFLYADGTVSQDSPAHTVNELATEVVAPVFTYYGGHVYPNLSAFEVTSLQSAGYVVT